MPSPLLAQDWYRRNGKIVRVGANPYIPALIGVAGAPATYLAQAQAADPTVRPTGPGFFRFEDLYQTGDTASNGTINMNEVMVRNRAFTEGKAVTFPEGEFLFEDFTKGPVGDPNAPGGWYMPPWIAGIVGSGMGTLGGNTGTIFSLRPGSSTKAYPAIRPDGKYYVPPQGNSQPVNLHTVKSISPLYPMTFRHFQVRGVDQGHNFCNFQIYEAPDVDLEYVLSSGWQGDAGAPPGECFGLQCNSRGNPVLKHVTVDGRRQIGGMAYGASGMTFQNCAGALFEDCEAKFCRSAGFVLYQSFDSTMIRCVVDANAGTQGIGNGGMNMERTNGTKIIDSTIIARPSRVHISHSNDFYTLNRNGKTYSSAGGTLDIINPTFNAPFNNGFMYVQSWTPYALGTFGTGNSMTYPNATGAGNAGPDRSPRVYKTDGTPITYMWSFDINRKLRHGPTGESVIVP